MSSALPAYESYRESGVDWLGDIPKKWEVAPLFRLLRERSVRNTGNQVQDVLSLSYGRIVPRDIDANFGLLPESFETYQIVEQGNIVLRLTDLQNDKRSLRVGHVALRGIITSAYVNLESAHDVDDRFAFYLLNAYDLLKVFYGMGAGVRQTMKFADLKRMPCVVPPRAEQKSIARFLDRETARIDTLIDKQQRLINRLEEKRKAVISHAVTHGLDPNAKLRNSGVQWLGQIPEDWDVVRLKWCTSHIVDCLHATPVYVAGGEYPALRTADVSHGRLDLAGAKRVDREEHQLRTRRLKPEAFDIVYSREGERFGHAALIPPGVDVCVSQRMMHFRARDDVNPAFLMWALNADNTYRQAALDSIGSTAPHVNVKTIRDFVLAIPSAEEAQRISESVHVETEKLDLAEKRIGALIEELRERRTALIAAAVTGKIDVREAV